MFFDVYSIVVLLFIYVIDLDRVSVLILLFDGRKACPDGVALRDWIVKIANYIVLNMSMPFYSRLVFNKYNNQCL
ncbi:hypothetical protein Hanom_Chr15g01364291 [Helianthus anomalus]